MKVLYFAWLRSRIGQAEERFALPAEIGTVGQLVDWLKGHSPGHAEAFADENVVRAAVNQEFSPFDRAIVDSDEIAFFPPVTGG